MRNVNDLPGGVIVIPIEIREGEYVRISGIPHDLTKNEAAKISGVILAMRNTPILSLKEE